ncbi:MAG TPA: acyltransferase [Ktedonobacterales bacterium]
MATVQTAKRLSGLQAIVAIFKRLMPASGALRDIPPLDGLRALAVLLVIWHHFYQAGAQNGLDVGPAALNAVAGLAFCGVFLFFILSGFLLFLPYARTLLAEQPWPSARKFYLRRALRILPAYYTALAAGVLIYVGFLRSGERASLFLAPLLLFDMRSDSFSAITQINAPFWTLAVEWQFYLLLPWLALALAKLAGARASRRFFLRLALGLVGLVILGLAIRVAAAIIHYDWGEVDPINAPGLIGFAMKLLYGIKGKYLELFALGMGTSVFYVWAVERGNLSIRRGAALGWLATGTAVAGLTGCVFWAVAVRRTPFQLNISRNWIFVAPGGELWTILGEWTLGLCFAFLLLGVLVGQPILRRIFSMTGLRFIGIISYSLYLWHYPILTFLAQGYSASLPHAYLSFTIAGLVLIFPVASASFYLIERPFIRLRRAAHSRAEQESALSARAAS